MAAATRRRLSKSGLTDTFRVIREPERPRMPKRPANENEIVGLPELVMPVRHLCGRLPDAQATELAARVASGETSLVPTLVSRLIAVGMESSAAIIADGYRRTMADCYKAVPRWLHDVADGKSKRPAA